MSSYWFKPFKPAPKQIFAPHANTYVSITYALDIYERCKTVEDAVMKKDMYAMYGVDGDMVERYLDEVMKLERLFQKKNQE